MEEEKNYCKECCRDISEEESKNYNGLCRKCYSSKYKKTHSNLSMGFITYVICASVILFFLSFQGYSEFKTVGKIIIFLCMMCPFVFFPLGIKIYFLENEKKQRIQKEKINALSDEKKKEYYEKIRKEKLNNEIDYTIIVGGDSRKSVGSSIIRGTIGGALLGPVGLVGGALSGKNKSQTTFTIIYKSGRREVITADNDSEEFQKYASYLK